MEQELAVVDPDQYQAEIEKKEMERIKERLTLKHSQRTTKWSQRASKLKDLSSKQVPLLLLLFIIIYYYLLLLLLFIIIYYYNPMEILIGCQRWVYY